MKKKEKIPYRQFTQYENKIEKILGWFNHNADKGIECCIEFIPKPTPGGADQFAVWVIGQRAGADGPIENTDLIRGEIIKEANGFSEKAGNALPF